MPDASSVAQRAATLLDGIDTDAQRKILAEGRPRKLREGQVLYGIGEPAESLFVLLKGQVQMSRPTPSGRESLVAVLVPGDVFGLVCLLTRTPSYMGTAEAMDSGEVMCWDRATVQRLARSHPQLTANALSVALSLIGRLADRHEALIDAAAPDRLARVLSDLGTRSGTRSPEGIDIHIKNEQLAALADISAFTASRLLQQWERDGAVKKRRGAVRIVDPERLLSHPAA